MLKKYYATQQAIDSVLKDFEIYPGDVAQTVRACGSYPQCPGFDSLHRHQL
jgi:hypothetical protein